MSKLSKVKSDSRLGARLNNEELQSRLKLQLHDAIYRLRFYSNSLTHILSLSNSHNNVVSIQKNRDDKSHRVIVALISEALTVNLNKSLKSDFNKHFKYFKFFHCWFPLSESELISINIT